MNREDVYDIVDSERCYQDERWAGHKHEVGAHLTLLRSYMREAEEAWVFNNGDRLALQSIRKIAGIAVACMEEHGAEHRELNPVQSGGL